MMSIHVEYFERLVASFIRGSLGSSQQYMDLFEKPLDALTTSEIHILLELAREQELRVHRFKRTMDLPRVRKVLGILKGIQPHTLLDIGSGRGAFLWPLLDSFPQTVSDSESHWMDRPILPNRLRPGTILF